MSPNSSPNRTHIISPGSTASTAYNTRIGSEILSFIHTENFTLYEKIYFAKRLAISPKALDFYREKKDAKTEDVDAISKLTSFVAKELPPFASYSNYNNKIQLEALLSLSWVDNLPEEINKFILKYYTLFEYKMMNDAHNIFLQANLAMDYQSSNEDSIDLVAEADESFDIL